MRSGAGAGVLAFRFRGDLRVGQRLSAHLAFEHIAGRFLHIFGNLKLRLRLILMAHRLEDSTAHRASIQLPTDATDAEIDRLVYDLNGSAAREIVLAHGWESDGRSDLRPDPNRATGLQKSESQNMAAEVQYLSRR